MPSRATELILIAGAGLVLGALLITLVARRGSQRRRERDERVLDMASAALESASTEADVFLVGVHAALEVVNRVNAAIQLRAGDTVVAGLGAAPVDVRAEVPVPVQGDDLVLLVATDERLSRRTEKSLESLAALLALALERLRAPDELRERRTA